MSKSLLILNKDEILRLSDAEILTIFQPIKPQPDYFFNCIMGDPQMFDDGTFGAKTYDGAEIRLKPPHAIGQILRVKEPWKLSGEDNLDCKGHIHGKCPYESCMNPDNECFEQYYIYEAQFPHMGPFNSARSMPEDATRIQLQVLRCYPKRIDTFTDADIVKMGYTCREHFYGNFNVKYSVPKPSRTERHITHYTSFFAGISRPGDPDYKETIYRFAPHRHFINPYLWVTEMKSVSNESKLERDSNQ